MEQMPQFVTDAGLNAAVAAEAYQAALHELECIEFPSKDDNAKFLAAAERAAKAQEYFDALIQHFKYGGPYPVGPQD